MLTQGSIRRRLHRDDEGMTMLEVVVALALLGIIMAPLTMAFVSMIRSSQAVDYRLGAAADAQRIGEAWTRDVQSVDPEGVNPEGVSCAATSPVPLEVQLITFQWDTASTATDAGEPVKLASWVVTGNGSDQVLERRYCEDGVNKATQKIATSFGKDGVAALEAIHGPTGTNRNFCPARPEGVAPNQVQVSDSCTISVTGAFSYKLTVSRRLPLLEGADAIALAPGPPTITGATGLNTHIVATWTAPVLVAGQPPINGYRLFAFTDPDGDPVTSIELDGNSSAGDLTGLDNDTPYYLRVQARNSVGWGDLSAAFGPVTPKPTVPEKPTGVTLSPGDTTATASWTAPANNGGSAVTGWKVWAQPATGPELGPFDASTTSFTFPAGTLVNGTSYTVVVSAVNALGVGDRSDPSAAAIPYGIPGLAVITDASSLPDGKIRVTWTAPTANPAGASVPNGGRDISGYQLVVDSGGSGGPWPLTGQLSASTLSYDLDGLTLGNTYTFRVRTYNPRGFSLSAPSTGRLARSLPGVPTNVTAVATAPGSIKVAWGAPAASGSPVLEYRVRSVPVTSTPTPSATTFETTFNGLASGTSYTFYVQARTEAGWGAEGSAVASATGAPNGPAAVTVVRQSGNTYPFAVDLSWPAVTNKGGGCIKGYRIEYSTNGSTVAGSNVVNGNPNASCGGEPARSYGWTGLAAGVQTRYFRVVAINTFNLEGTSGWASIQMQQVCSVSATEDAYIDEFNGGVFSSGRRGNNYGTSGDLLTSKNGSRSLIKFDPRSNGTACSQFGLALPSAAVTVASDVQVFKRGQDGISGGRDIEIWRSGRAWSQSNVTYNSYNGTGGTYEYNRTAVVNTGSDNTTYTWWVNNGDVDDQRNDSGRNGWLLKDDGDFNVSNIFTTYRSREGSGGSAPTLRITFY